MANHQGKNIGLLIVFILLMISCKDLSNTESNIKAQPTEKANNLAQSDSLKTKATIDKANCLVKSDSLLIKQFLSEMSVAFSKNDTQFIIQKVLFPYAVGNRFIEDVPLFLKFDYKVLKDYLNKKDISEDDLEFLERNEYFAATNTNSACFEYIMFSSFGELEFTVIINLTKHNNEIKVSEILVAG